MKSQKLQPIHTAPKDGSKILIYVNYPWDVLYKFFTIATWEEKYSTQSEKGAWRYETDDAVLNVFDEWCLGWIPFPDIPLELDKNTTR